MALRQYLADKFTPMFLMGLCEGLTGFQSEDVVRPFIGQWMKVRGTLFRVTPNSAFGTAGVTIEFEGVDWKKGGAFLTFTRSLDRLAQVPHNGVIHAEGRIKSISSSQVVLEDCSLLDEARASIMEVAFRADELKRVCEDRVASENPITLKPVSPAEPKSDPKPPPKPKRADTRKNVAPAEMEKFAKLLLEGWPNTTETEAHAKAAAFFFQNKVPVKPFLDIFRVIRGDRKPGPRPKSGN